jgi:hypothetical protein
MRIYTATAPLKRLLPVSIRQMDRLPEIDALLLPLSQISGKRTRAETARQQE